jgi:hypothetical protein
MIEFKIFGTCLIVFLVCAFINWLVFDGDKTKLGYQRCAITGGAAILIGLAALVVGALRAIWS